MAKQTTKPSVNISKILGEDGEKAHAAHKADETVLPGGGSLPAGIENGIAQLTDIGFKLYGKGDMKGKAYFFATGSIFAPDEAADGTPVKGLFTRIQEPVCDTPKRTRKSKDEHMKWVYNALRLLGLDTSKIKSLSQLQPAIDALKEAGPFFRFRTWKGEMQTEGEYAGKEPRVNETWGAACQYDPETGESSEDDQTGDAEPVDDAEGSSAEGSAESTGDDLDALLAAANGGDVPSQNRLNELAIAAGHSPDIVEATNSYDETVEMINNPVGGEGETGEATEAAEETTEFVPEPEQLYDIMFKDPANSKAKAKKVEIEVLTVNTKNKTVTGKFTKDDKKVLGKDKKPLPIKFDELLGE